MAHGDDRGLKLPPKVAPIQVVIVPIAAHKEGVVEEAKKLQDMLNENYRVELDVRDNYSTGYKFNYWELRGVPVRIEIGPRDIENKQCVIVRRDTFEKQVVLLENINDTLNKLLDEIQIHMFNECKERMERKTTVATNMEEFEKNLKENQGFIKAMWCGDEACEDKIKELTGAKSRCIPFEEEQIGDKCVCCGKPAKHMVVWGRQY